MKPPSARKQTQAQEACSALALGKSCPKAGVQERRDKNHSFEQCCKRYWIWSSMKCELQNTRSLCIFLEDTVSRPCSPHKS